MDFDHNLHQKVTYFGTNKDLRKSQLYVVIKEEFPSFHAMKPHEKLVIHIVNRFNQIVYNSDLPIRELYTVRRDQLKPEGELYEPESWS